MSLKEQITENMKAAMRAKDAPRLLTILGLLAACKQREVGRTHRARRRGGHGHHRQAGQSSARTRSLSSPPASAPLVDKESAELRVLEAYLPQRPERRGHRRRGPPR